jgi:hypothetical protein
VLTVTVWIGAVGGGGSPIGSLSFFRLDGLRAGVDADCDAGVSGSGVERVGMFVSGEWSGCGFHGRGSECGFEVLR